MHEPAYRADLDGLRAVAVVLVLLFHADLGIVPGGYLGVSVFFTLSGYLITRLLVVEVERTDRIDLRRFWVRRARRLLPAATICLLGVLAAAAAGWLPTTDGLAVDVWSSIVQVFNWAQLGRDGSYADLLSETPGALDHFWSLSIEEQFYWTWPLILLLVARRGPDATRRLVAGAAALGAVSAPLIAWRFGADAAYWSTPARAAEILVGAVLAVFERRDAVTGRSDRWRPAAATGGLAVILVCSASWPSGGGPAYQGWLPVFALATVAVLWGASAPSLVGRLLRAPALVGLGRISYGVYLYHWPVYLVLRPGVTGLDEWSSTALRLAVTIAIAVVSHLALERPIRNGRLPTPRLAASLAIAAAILAIVAIPYRASPSRFEGALPIDALGAVAPGDPLPPAATSTSSTTAPRLAGREAPVPVATSLATVAPTTTTTTTTTSTTTTTTTAVVALGAALLDDALAGPLPVPEVGEPVDIVVVGDSTAWALSDGLVAWAGAHPSVASVTTVAGPGCSLLSGVRSDAFDAEFAAICDERVGVLFWELVRAEPPDTVVLMSSVADVEEWTWEPDEGELVPPDPRFAQRMQRDYQAWSRDLLAAGVGTVVWVKGPRPAPAYAKPTMDAWRPGRTELQHDVIDRVAVGERIVALDLARWYAASEYGPGDSGRSDGVHLDVPVATDIATRFAGPWLIAVSRGSGST